MPRAVHRHSNRFVSFSLINIDFIKILNPVESHLVDGYVVRIVEEGKVVDLVAFVPWRLVFDLLTYQIFSIVLFVDNFKLTRNN